MKEINNTLSEDEKRLLKEKQARIGIIAKQGDSVAFYDAYREFGEIRLIQKPDFISRCDFNKVKQLAKAVFDKWRPFDPRGTPYLLITGDDFILTNLEEVMRRAFIFCTLMNESKNVKELIQDVNGMTALEALYWSGELRRGWKEDKSYYNRARTALRILLGET